MMLKSKGFTLIELLVVFTIIILLPAIVISNFPQIKNQFALSRVVYKVSQDIRMVQNMALSSVPYKDSFGKLQSVGGYGIYINTNALGNKKYVLYADNNDGGSGNQQYDSLDHIVGTVDFRSSEPGVIIKEIDNAYGDGASINFSSPDANTNITNLNQGQHGINIVFALEGDLAKTRMISINTSGLIEVK
jgi:prepilin-type N-terminal cleavage/methylation domain-containing protein